MARKTADGRFMVFGYGSAGVQLSQAQAITLLDISDADLADLMDFATTPIATVAVAAMPVPVATIPVPVNPTDEGLGEAADGLAKAVEVLSEAPDRQAEEDQPKAVAKPKRVRKARKAVANPALTLERLVAAPSPILTVEAIPVAPARVPEPVKAKTPVRQGTGRKARRQLKTDGTQSNPAGLLTEPIGTIIPAGPMTPKPELGKHAVAEAPPERPECFENLLPDGRIALTKVWMMSGRSTVDILSADVTAPIGVVPPAKSILDGGNDLADVRKRRKLAAQQKTAA